MWSYGVNQGNLHSTMHVDVLLTDKVVQSKDVWSSDLSKNNRYNGTFKSKHCTMFRFEIGSLL